MLEAAEFAHNQNHYDPMHHALFKAFKNGLDLNEVQVLVDTDVSVDPNSAALRTALEQGTSIECALRDQPQAHDLGLTAVPALLIRRCDQPFNAAQTLSGAQPFDVVSCIVDSLLKREPGINTRA